MSKRPDDEFPAAPSPPGRIVCGYCAHRWAGVIDPDCPICAGAGYLELGRASLARFGDKVTARAVEVGLEAAARKALTRTPGLVSPSPLFDPAGDKAALTAAVAMMRRARLLGGEPSPSKRTNHATDNAGDVVDWIGGERPRRGTAYPLSFAICDLRPATAAIPGPDTAPPSPARRRGRRASKRRRPGGR